MNKFKFEKLEVWNLSMELAERIVEDLVSFPEREKFNISSQMQRAVDSIALNIAEGSIGQSNPEFKRFLSYSIRSTAETATCLIKAVRREYISIETFEKRYSSCYEIINKLIALKRSI